MGSTTGRGESSGENLGAKMAHGSRYGTLGDNVLDTLLILYFKLNVLDTLLIRIAAVSERISIRYVSDTDT